LTINRTKYSLIAICQLRKSFQKEVASGKFGLNNRMKRDYYF